MPNCIITDNDTPFTMKEFLNFCNEGCCGTSTVEQVKRANCLILQGLKQCILNGWRSLQWVTEMPSIACLEIAHNTQSIDQLHPVFYGLRYRCHPSNRSWLRSSHVKTYNENKSKEARQDALPAWRSSGASGSLVCALLLWSTSCTCVCLAN